MTLYRRFAVAALAGLFAASAANAQTVQYSGTTTGCFFVDAGPCNTSDQGLSFQGANPFTAAIALGSSGTVNLGSFTLAPATGWTPDLYLGENFFLNVLFTLPSIASPNTVFQASILGAVVPGLGGGLDVHFDGAPAIFYFDGPTTSGAFTLALSDVALGTGPISNISGLSSSGTLSGYISTTATPEPATVGLLALGLLALVPVARRRLRADRAT